MAVESTDTTSYMVVRNDDEKPVVTCDVMATKINSFIAVKLAEGAYPLEINYSDMEKAVGLLEYSHGDEDSRRRRCGNGGWRKGRWRTRVWWGGCCPQPGVPQFAGPGTYADTLCIGHI